MVGVIACHRQFTNQLMSDNLWQNTLNLTNYIYGHGNRWVDRDRRKVDTNRHADKQNRQEGKV